MPRERARSATSNPSTPAVPAGCALGYRAGEVVSGKYELVRVIGSGGMGAVWAVRNLIIDAEFALKMLRNDGGDAHAAERMLREARSAASIEHPAVVRTFDFGVTERGDPYLVMDLLAGTSLRELLLAGPMSPVDAVKLILPVAGGLCVAHSRGIMHRDVKTDNIVVVSDGAGRHQPKLVDFGIAKRVGRDAQRLTVDGTVIGSPEYMSPEQARGLADIDHKTDVWSLAVVLYEMITGRTPFYREGGIVATFRAITDEAAPPLADQGVDEPELDAVLARGLAKLPSGRFADMHTFGEALARWLLARGVEEDVSSMSIRAVWFGASASAPPVSLDMVAPAGRGGRREDMEIAGLPRRRATMWNLGAFASILAAGLAVAGALHSTGLLEGPELAAVDDVTHARQVFAPNIEFVPAFPERTPAARAALAASAPPLVLPSETSRSARPLASASESSVRQPVAPLRTQRRVGAARIARADEPQVDRPSAPTPRGIDVSDLPPMRNAPASAPSRGADTGDRSSPKLPSDPLRDVPVPTEPPLKAPYRTDNPY